MTIIPLSCVFVAVVALFEATSAQEVLKARAWQNVKDVDVPSPDFHFPEEELLQDRPSTGVLFTGGGSRSYVASIGYLAGLYELELTEKIKYIGGISGGSWATMVYTYSQHDSANEGTFLGPVVAPEDITEDNLKIMDHKCARGVADASFTAVAMDAVHACSTLGDMWCYATQQVYLNPVGIEANKHWAWTEAQVMDIVSRNPDLRYEDFLLPNDQNKGFPIIGSSLVGPQSGAPYTYKRENVNYTFFEMTPMYVGHVKTLHMEYNHHHKHSDAVQHRTVGGFVETFAFNRKANSTDGSNIAPTVGLASDESTGFLNVPTPAGILDIAAAAGASSYAPGAFFDTFDLNKDTSLHFNYWSPSDPMNSGETSKRGNTYDTLFADGGSYENIPLISMIQRGVQKVVYCSNSHTPLSPTASWDVDADPTKQATVDTSIPAFFGIGIENKHKYEDRSYEYNMNQVFATEDYAAVIKGLQAAQAAGNGIIYRTKLSTVENTWWNVKAGTEVDITFVYLGRLAGWEAQLSADMRKKVQPNKDAGDLAKTVRTGPYKHFPHYATNAADVSPEAANLLADMNGWLIKQNAELFRDILS